MLKSSPNSCFDIMQHHRDPDRFVRGASAGPVVDGDHGGAAIFSHYDIEGYQKASVILGQYSAPRFELTPDDKDGVFSATHSHALPKREVEWHLADNFNILCLKRGSQTNQRFVERAMYDSGE